MKSRLVLSCLLALPVLLRAASVDSHISDATVYLDRALVTRSGSVEVSAGENTLVFEQLPAGLVDGSLQFSATGTTAATILDVNAQTVFVASTPVARVKELEDQVRGLKRQLRALDGRAGVLGEEHDFVKRMLVSSTSLGGSQASGDAARPPRPTVEDWQKLYGYSEEALGKIASELQSIDEQRQEIRDKQAALEQQLGELRGNGSRSVKNVAVRVSAASAGRLEVALRYALPGAEWQPAYDARLDSDQREVELDYFGIVHNATGEDWTGINLTLSTARPGLGGGAPELRPWVVDVYQPAPMVTSFGVRRERDVNAKAVAGAGGKLQNFTDYPAAPAEAADAVAEVGRLAEAVVQSNATSATFRIATPVTVVANNSAQKVSISSARLKADLRYESTPKVMETAFLGASAVNATEFPLLAGAMNTFLDGTFVAASRLRTVMPGEKFELQLGADEGIAIKRTLLNRFSENTGLTGGGRRITYDILVTVTNHKKTAQRVAFKEALPVSRNEKIEVALLSPDAKDVGTKDAPKEVTREDDGKLVWRLDLKPGEKREVPVKFSVEYPADVTVSGLE